MDIENADLLLSTTRSVRRRLDLDRPVPRGVILDCVRMAVQAPTASNGQKWRWVVVTDPEKRSRLAEIYGGTGRPYLEAGARGELSDDPQTIRVYESALYLMSVMHRVPVHVIPCIEGRVGDPGNMSGASFYGSIMQAAWSFVLALRARGLGSVWTTLHLQGEQDAAELLGIPYESVSQIALLPVAYTVGTDFKPARRGPVEEITYWDAWGATERA
ncbi:MAG TPA: nitroreductase family protein [Acidimicrobiia bacterium]|nr:nitroreductase family protein [Acidimicrobiia bacterium]